MKKLSDIDNLKKVLLEHEEPLTEDAWPTFLEHHLSARHNKKQRYSFKLAAVWIGVLATSSIALGISLYNVIKNYESGTGLKMETIIPQISKAPDKSNGDAINPGEFLKPTMQVSRFVLTDKAFQIKRLGSQVKLVKGEKKKPVSFDPFDRLDRIVFKISTYCHLPEIAETISPVSIQKNGLAQRHKNVIVVSSLKIINDKESNKGHGLDFGYERQQMIFRNMGVSAGLRFAYYRFNKEISLGDSIVLNSINYLASKSNHQTKIVMEMPLGIVLYPAMLKGFGFHCSIISRMQFYEKNQIITTLNHTNTITNNSESKSGKLGLVFASDLEAGIEIPFCIKGHFFQLEPFISIPVRSRSILNNSRIAISGRIAF